MSWGKLSVYKGTEYPRYALKTEYKIRDVKESTIRA